MPTTLPAGLAARSAGTCDGVWRHRRILIGACRGQGSTTCKRLHSPEPARARWRRGVLSTVVSLIGVPGPNRPVIHELRAYDIDVAVCGQAIMDTHYQQAWIGPRITRVPSVLVVIIERGQKGHVLVQM